MKIAVISDTHIPDRAEDLHPELIGELNKLQVDLILHAGDISVPSVLTRLSEIAPVKAVRGNRDLLFTGQLPNAVELELNGIGVVLTHGHLNFLTYWWDKFHYMLRGYDRNRIIRRLEGAFPNARVVVYGHTHRAENLRLNGRLFFNPGSAAVGDLWVHSCSFGLLEIDDEGNIRSRLVPLEGYELSARNWRPLP